MDEFRNKYLPLSKHIYLSSEDLKYLQQPADFIVCGSDQIWNIASFRGFDSAFFLDFIDGKNTRGLSYAASFGYADDLGIYRKTISDLLLRFHHLSVRDIRSQNMVRDLTGCNAEHVLDPCFLTEYHLLTLPRMIRKPYIIVYCLKNNDLFIKTVRYLFQKLGFSVISINMRFDNAKVIWSAGPQQWLSLMRHADFVCTNSFHGVCFSLLNRKNFVALPTARGQARIEDILQTAGLSERLIKSEEELECIVGQNVKYDIVIEKLTKAKEHSLFFLQESLS